MMRPEMGSANRRKLMPSVDLPLPVRPMRPIFSFGLISNETSWITGGSSGEY